MKKLLFAVLLISHTLALFAQNKPDTSLKTIDCYVAGSVSVPTGNSFKQDAYPSFEFGINCKNMTFGINTGRMSFDKSPFNGEKIDNYYSEIKMMTSFPIGQIKGYIVGGWGMYYNSSHEFIEYGAGVVYSVNKIDFMLQVSNWNQIVYLSPGIAYNFSFKK
jgi:hypothetical protein